MNSGFPKNTPEKNIAAGAAELASGATKQMEKSRHAGEQKSTEGSGEAGTLLEQHNTSNRRSSS